MIILHVTTKPKFDKIRSNPAAAFTTWTLSTLCDAMILSIYNYSVSLWDVVMFISYSWLGISHTYYVRKPCIS